MMQTEQSKMQTFPEDSIIMREGEFYTEMYKIVSGKVAIYINYGQKNEYLMGILSEQQCFGELGLLCKTPCMYTVVAVYEVLLMRITEEDFGDFVQNNAQNATNIIKNLSWTVTNLKCNLDMVLDELSNENSSPKMNAAQLREQMYRNYTQAQERNKNYADVSESFDHFV